MVMNDIPNWFFFEEKLCVPIGIISGMIGGFINEILRHSVTSFFLKKRWEDFKWLSTQTMTLLTSKSNLVLYFQIKLLTLNLTNQKKVL